MSIALDSVTAIQLVHAMNCLLEAIQVTTGYSLQANLLSKVYCDFNRQCGCSDPGMWTCMCSVPQHVRSNTLLSEQLDS